MRQQDWRTPPKIFKALQLSIPLHYDCAGFKYDLACEPHNCLVHPLAKDSLSVSWPKDVALFCNPPWNNIQVWVEKAIIERSMVCFLLPARMDTSWFRWLLKEACVELYAGRIAFDDPLLAKRMSPREGCIAAWMQSKSAHGLVSTGFRDPKEGFWL